MLKWVKSEEHLKNLQKKHKDILVLAFYGAFSDAAKRALMEWKQFSAENGDIPLYIINVQKLKGIHKKFGINGVPTVIIIKNGGAIHRIEGVQNYRFYERVVLDISTQPAGKKGKEERRNRYVVVYSGPGCPACGSAKRYLRKHRIRFREVDISKDQQAAKRLTARSGQMAVPQIDINGELVVGFDQAKIDRLLAQ